MAGGRRTPHASRGSSRGEVLRALASSTTIPLCIICLVMLGAAASCAPQTSREPATAGPTGPSRPAGPSSAGTSAGPSGSSPAHDNAPVPCFGRTVDVGLHAGYIAGQRTQVRLCAVPGLPSDDEESTPGSPHYVVGADRRAVVSSTISESTWRLVRAAARLDVTLSVSSSFRTHQHQRTLCRQDGLCSSGDYTLVAPPGFSNHQAGVALDFDGTHVVGAQTCRERARDPRSAVWRFLNTRGRALGFRQYAAESWHWEVSDARHRC